MDSLNPNEYNPFSGKKKGATYTQEQISFIKELLDKGWNANRIAKTYGISKDSIKKRIESNNWIANENRKSKLTNKELQKIHEMVLQGESKEKICEKYKISLESLQRRITNNKWENAARKNRYTFNENYFDVIDDEHKAYWLGFLYADGYILSKRIRRERSRESQSFGFCISTQDSELFEKFKKDLNATNPVNYYKGGAFKKESSVGRILLTSQHTVDSLKKLGVVENKTFFLKKPPIEKEYMPAFIRGYSDGDGSVYICKNGKYGWGVDGTKEFLTAIQEFFGTNVKLDCRFPERENNHYALHYCGNQQVPKLLDIIYKDATIYLQRKYDKYAEMRGKNV